MKPGRELDALVAEKVMGLAVEQWKNCYAVAGNGPGSICVVDEKTDKILHRFSHGSQDLRPYSTSIEAAWEVVEKVCALPSWPEYDHTGKIQTQREQGVFRIERTYSLCNEGRWHAYGTDRDQEYELFGAYADTAPHAICLAALAAVRKT